MRLDSSVISASWRRKAVRYLFLIHRYLGIGVGLLMVVWCLSGMVMIYESYPSLPAAKRIAALEPLSFRQCCAETASSAIAPSTLVRAVRVEMLGGRPIADVDLASGTRELLDLRAGTGIGEVSMRAAAAVASQFARRWGLPATAQAVRTVTWDQWITSEDFDGLRPYYKFWYDDPARSQLYVSAVSGKAMQFTTEKTRFWNWLGAVPHWVYFEPLRRHEFYWVQFIILASAIGTFLTLTGIYVGVRQYVSRPARRTSPYRGYMFWHHIPGLVFGIFLLTWVFSGMLSVTPYGFLDGGSFRTEQQRLEGAPPTWDSLLASLQRIARQPWLDGLVSLRSAPLAGRLFFIGTFQNGARVRLNAMGQRADLSSGELALEAHLLGAPQQVLPRFMRTADTYYFSVPSASVLLPVYRVVLGEPRPTRYYLDPLSGSILGMIDANARGYRWLFDGLHRLDFTQSLRSRPTWDILMLTLLLGASVVAGTGLYSAVLRVTGRRRSLGVGGRGAIPRARGEQMGS